MKTQIVYKVVSSHSPYVSARCRGTYKQQYKIGIPTSNPKMPLFAFKTLGSAKYMAWCCETILKCEAVLSPHQPKTIARWDSTDGINLFWKQVWNKKKITAGYTYKDTSVIFCSSITPLEVVK